MSSASPIASEILCMLNGLPQNSFHFLASHSELHNTSLINLSIIVIFISKITTEVQLLNDNVELNMKSSFDEIVIALALGWKLKCRSLCSKRFP